MLKASQVHLKPEVAAKLGPMGRVRKRKAIALHANLMAAAGKSSKSRLSSVLSGKG